MEKLNKLGKVKGNQKSNIAIEIDLAESSDKFTLIVQTVPFPLDCPCQLNNLQIILSRKGQGNQETPDQKARYSGSISGVFAVPAVDFKKQFFFKIPFSIKYGTCIALSYSTNDFTNDKLSLLNKFVFGEQQVKPLAISRNAASEVAGYLIHSAKGFQKIQKLWQKTIKFLRQNNVNLSLLIDYSQKNSMLDFSGNSFISKDILFGLSFDFNPGNTKNQFALKIGGTGSFDLDGKSHADLYIEYGLDSQKQKLEVGGTLTLLTSLIQSLSLKLPEQIQQFAKDASLNISWVSDVGKKITDEIKNSEK